MPSERVCITGVGIVSPLGNSRAALGQNLFEGRSAVAAVDVGGLSIPAARCTDNDGPRNLGLCDAVGSPRSVRMAVAAARRATADAGLDDADFDRHRAGVFVGVGSSPIEVVFDNYRSLHDTGRVGPMTLLRGLPSAPATFVAIDRGFRGACHCYTTACASGMMALSQAAQQIASGRIDIAIAGGVEAPLDWGDVAAWKALRVLAPVDPADPSRSCRPFAARRGGVVLGEGGALFVVENEASAMARGATILATIAGAGESCDASHLTKPDADGQLRCMMNTLADARMTAGDIDLVVAHGTGTVVGDTVETRSLRVLLGSRADQIIVTGNKALLGHTLGASGAFNLYSAIMAIEGHRISGTYHLDSADANCDLNYLPNRSIVSRDIGNVLVNTFGFGGINTCLVVSRPQ